MTTYIVNSTVISNRDASPKVLTDSYVSGGDVKESEGYIQTHGAADGIGTVYRFCTVPSNSRVSAVDITNDSLGTNCAMSLGVYWPTFTPLGAGLAVGIANTVIHTTLFTSALAMSASATQTNVINSSGVNGIASQELPLWQAAGLASDPGIDLDICGYLTGSNQIQGFIGLKVKYCH